MHRYRWPTVILISLIALPLTACGLEPESVINNIPAAIVERIEDSEFNRLILTEKAAQRLGIESSSIREQQIDGTQRIVIPYAAVLYDVNGGTWAYTTAEPLIFIRQMIRVDYIEGDTAILLEGLSAGVEVVTVGVSELYGLDTGVGK